eukprot:NODE_523_length_6504_cov_0.524434.p6 type:complete len:118 gc:universal NODE_523_length_6504_cov_0.524434:4278-4631(+)
MKDLPPKEIIHKYKITAHTGLQIKDIIAEDPLLPLRQIEAQLEQNVSYEIIRQYIIRQGYHTSIAKRKIELRAQNIIKRINFADIYVDRPLIYWRNILWSDECTFKSHPHIMPGDHL